MTNTLKADIRLIRDLTPDPGQGAATVPLIRRGMREIGTGSNGKGASHLSARIPSQHGLRSFVGRSPAIASLANRIRRVAPSSASVLISGESGTGKELVARAIHDISDRAGPFIAVNCGAIAPSLMESELFGHERGSFTGASRRHRGYFERADQGTLFLDEITEMPLELQVKLLRVLETSQFTRLGAEATQTVDVRIVAATNRLSDGPVSDGVVAGGRLRQDLYYRLKVVSLHIPALRERPEDIPLLMEHFLSDLILNGDRVKHFDESVIPVLAKCRWPGNARELKNAVHTAYLLSETDEIVLSDFPAEVRSSEHAEHATETFAVRLRVGDSLREAERRLILRTLDHEDGNKTRTAHSLGISVKTLYNRLHDYGLMRHDEGESQDATASV